MKPRLLPPESIRRICGFGMVACGDAYVFQPADLKGVRDAIDLAKAVGRKVVLRGAGQSYGDANIGFECVAIDLTDMRRILSWDPAT